MEDLYVFSINFLISNKLKAVSYTRAVDIKGLPQLMHVDVLHMNVTCPSSVFIIQLDHTEKSTS